MNKSELLKYVIGAFLGLIITFPLLLAKELIPSFLELATYKLSKKELLLLATLLLLTTIGLIIYSLYLKSFLKLKLHFGIWWDKEKEPNPYCPTCKTPLTLLDDSRPKCYKCDKIIPIVNSKKRMGLSEAREIIKSLTKVSS